MNSNEKNFEDLLCEFTDIQVLYYGALFPLYMTIKTKCFNIDPHFSLLQGIHEQVKTGTGAY